MDKQQANVQSDNDNNNKETDIGENISEINVKSNVGDQIHDKSSTYNVFLESKCL